MRDVIVIGAGGGGAVVAKELASRGLDVLVIEAGGRHPHPEQEWNHFENDAANPISGYFRWGPSDRSKSPWERDFARSAVMVQVAGVGGTTQHYFGNSPRAQPGVFRGYAGVDRNAYDRAHEFPLGYCDLVPYYEWVEHTLPVQTAPMGTKEEIFLRAAERVELPLQTSKDITRAAYRPQENAILQPQGTAGRTANPDRLRYPQARGCTFCGYCYLGCYEPRGAPRNLAAKRSTDASYIPMALTADAWHQGGKPITLITDAFVTNLTTASEAGQTVARAVTWRDQTSGAMHQEEGKVVVMSAGCIENPRLWLNSGLPNPNGWVGQGLTDHGYDFVVGKVPFDAGFSRGPNSNARADIPGRGALEHIGLPPALTASIMNLSDSGMAGLYDNGAPVGRAGADSVGRLVGKQLRSFLSDIDRLVGIQIYTDDDVETQNRVTISSVFPPDENGPVPQIDMHRRDRTSRTRKNREYMAALAVKVLRAAGATKVARLDWQPILLHVQSTMRMGTDAKTSVLDENAESRFVRRLFVADNSALANALGSPNPTLTTQALATRTAEKIFSRYFGGDPWVHQEAPLASTAPEVTKAVLARGL
jgi:choline dehydrogenase-like flavoprotein